MAHDSIFNEVQRELARDRRRSSGYFVAASIIVTAIVVLFVLTIVAGAIWSSN